MRLPRGAILLDLTEICARPIRTGIQRVEREVIRHWPGPRPLVPCRRDPASGRLVGLPERLLARLAEDPSHGGASEVAAERARLAPLLARARPLAAPWPNHLLNLELFLDEDRAAFYRGLIGSGFGPVSWLVYDFLPVLQPEFYPQGAAGWMMPYLRTLRDLPRIGFISAATRAEYRRVMRAEPPRGGPVFALGGDGLGLARQDFAPERRDFLMLGSIEPRKRVATVIEAFRGLWAEGAAARLVLIGRVLESATAERQLMRELAGEARLVHRAQASDAAVRAAFATARALVFPSRAEGFGLPPLESLAAGVPVIAWRDTPSLAALPPRGQMALSRATAEAIAGAVRALLDDALAARLFGEARRLTIPTWREFAGKLSAWVQDDGAG